MLEWLCFRQGSVRSCVFANSWSRQARAPGRGPQFNPFQVAPDAVLFAVPIRPALGFRRLCGREKVPEPLSLERLPPGPSYQAPGHASPAAAFFVFRTGLVNTPAQPFAEKRRAHMRSFS